MISTNLAYLTASKNGLSLHNLQEVSQDKAILIRAGIKNFGFLLSLYNKKEVNYFRLNEMAKLIRDYSKEPFAVSVKNAMYDAYIATLPKQIVMADAFKKDGLTQAEMDAVAYRIDGYFEDKPFTGKQGLSDEVLNSEMYTDFYTDVKYKDETEDEDFHSFVVAFSIDWDDRSIYVQVGNNTGEGFEPYLSTYGDNAPSGQLEALEAVIKGKSDDDEFKSLILAYPEAFAKIKHAVSKFDEMVKP